MPLKYLADATQDSPYTCSYEHCYQNTQTAVSPSQPCQSGGVCALADPQHVDGQCHPCLAESASAVRLTSKAFAHVEIGSAWINQTIRNANARTKVKQFRCLPLETNNQNWTLHKVGDTYSVSFGLRRGIKKRVPLAVHHAAHQQLVRCPACMAVPSPGSHQALVLPEGIWYACLSVSMDVPDAEPTGRWIGIDRGQNVPLAAATPDWPRHLLESQSYPPYSPCVCRTPQKASSAGKHRAVKKLERRERRIVTHINHCLSKDVVALAQRCNAGIRLEDLSGFASAHHNTRPRKPMRDRTAIIGRSFSSSSSSPTKPSLAASPLRRCLRPIPAKAVIACGALGRSKGHALCLSPLRSIKPCRCQRGA